MHCPPEFLMPRGKASETKEKREGLCAPGLIGEEVLDGRRIPVMAEVVRDNNDVGDDEISVDLVLWPRMWHCCVVTLEATEGRGSRPLRSILKWLKGWSPTMVMGFADRAL